MRPKKNISYAELIHLVPDELLSALAVETNVDHSVSKLTGKNMFCLLLYGLASGTGISLRILEAVWKTPILQTMNGGKNIRHSSIGARLKTMNPDYFKKIFDHLVTDERVERYMGVVGKKYAVKKIDSTIVTLTSKLLQVGMDIFDGRKDIKFSVGIMNALPTDIQLFTAQTYASEDKALKEIIARKRAKQSEKITILLFDRGVQSRDTLDEINRQLDTFFVSRLSSQSFQVDRNQSHIKGRPAGELILQSDEVIHFESKKEKRRAVSYRLVTAVHRETKEKYQFITDIFFLNAREICHLYKERWEIETFFKFLKQQLNFNHLISRSQNGITIMMYMTMIAAILIAMYKNINRITGWTIAKMKFINEMEAYILEHCFVFLASRWGFPKQSSLIYNTS